MRRIVLILLDSLVWLWTLPNTFVGLLLVVAGAATGGRVARLNGVIEAHGGWTGWMLARLPLGERDSTAVTLGHVVLATSHDALAVTRAHERVHVAQYEHWGPLFLPAYAVASLWAWLRRGDPYRENWFERKAYATDVPAQALVVGTCVQPVPGDTVGPPRGYGIASGVPRRRLGPSPGRVGRSLPPSVEVLP